MRECLTKTGRNGGADEYVQGSPYGQAETCIGQIDPSPHLHTRDLERNNGTTRAAAEVATQDSQDPANTTIKNNLHVGRGGNTYYLYRKKPKDFGDECSSALAAFQNYIDSQPLFMLSRSRAQGRPDHLRVPQDWRSESCELLLTSAFSPHP